MFYKIFAKMTIVRRVSLGFTVVGIVFLLVLFAFYRHYVDVAEVNETSEMLIVIGVGFGVIVFVTNISFSIVKSINVNLRGMIKEVVSVSAGIEDSSNTLSNMSNNLAQGNAEQAASIEETSAAMTQTTAMINQNAQNSFNAVNLSKGSEQAASTGVGQVKELATFMQDLDKNSNEISKIMVDINSIASQTTILALNASVEAVRAGEAGKTFSVVAEEVRNLAQRSTAASRSTEAIITENIQFIKRGLETFGQMETSLESISVETEKVTHLLNEIAQASQEQDRGVQQISLAMNELEKVTHLTTTVAEESATTAAKLQTQITDLNKVINQLKSLLGSFSEKS